MQRSHVLLSYFLPDPFHLLHSFPTRRSSDLHPITGRRALFVNGNSTLRLVGVPPRENEVLLRFMIDHVRDPVFQCRFRWDLHRSEEHTSELQSPCNLVCRLVLEKKNNKLTY